VEIVGSLPNVVSGKGIGVLAFYLDSHCNTSNLEELDVFYVGECTPASNATNNSMFYSFSCVNNTFTAYTCKSNTCNVTNTSSCVAAASLPTSDRNLTSSTQSPTCQRDIFFGGADFVQVFCDGYSALGLAGLLTEIERLAAGALVIANKGA